MSDVPRRVTLGRVAGVYGIKGWIKLQSFTRPIENILQYPRWTLLTRQPFETKVLEGRIHGRSLVAHITDAAGAPIEDRDVAAALLGAEVQVERSALPASAEGSWYWSDLIGLKVFNLGGEPLGQVVEVIDNGAQDVLVIEDGEVERMIPFVPGAIIESVDVAAGRIVADWSADW